MRLDCYKTTIYEKSRIIDRCMHPPTHTHRHTHTHTHTVIFCHRHQVDTSYTVIKLWAYSQNG